MDCAAFFGDGGIDAGQYLRGSVKVIVPGGNHGWNLREGNHAFDPENPYESLAEVPRAGRRGEPLVDAIVEYPNAGQPGGIGAVVIGGYVYRGERAPGTRRPLRLRRVEPGGNRRRRDHLRRDAPESSGSSQRSRLPEAGPWDPTFSRSGRTRSTNTMS